MRVRVVNINAYVRNRKRGALRRQLRRTRAHVIFAQEAQRLGNIRGYTRFTAPSSCDQHAREVPIYLRNDVAAGYLGHSVHKATDDLGTGLAHDRWITTVSFRWRGRKFRALCTHANAGVKGPDGRGPLRNTAAARQNRTLAARFAREVSEARMAGEIPITGADWNATARNTGPGTPVYLHAEQTRKMGYRSWGVDGIGYDKRHLALQHFTARPAAGSDHRLLTAVLEVKARRS